MNAREKKLLERKIYRILKESMYEGFMGEKNDSAKEQKNDIGVGSSRLNPDDGRRTKRASKEVEKKGLKMLRDDKVNMAAFARELWPEKDEDSARSEISKKVKGKDANGKPYHFTEEEMNTIANIDNTVIDKISESKLTSMISESIRKHLNKRF